MKSRQGFVSNSSTSSFICIKCGEIEAEFDSGPRDFDMIRCVNDHSIHKKCLDFELDSDAEDMIGEEFTTWFEDNKEYLSPQDLEKYTKILNEYENIPYNERVAIELGNGICIDHYGEIQLSEKACPACSFKSLYNQSTIKYLVLSGILSMDTIAEQLSSTFKNYKELYEWVNEHEK